MTFPEAAALVILASTLWVAYDSGRYDWKQTGFAKARWQWIVGTLLAWIVMFPIYLFQRSRAPLKA